MLHLSGSGLGVSGAVLAEIAPVLLLAPIAGPLVDRLPRVTVMVTADLVRVVLAAVLVLWHNDITIVYPVAFGLSAGSVFFNPAAGSLLPTLVAEEELVAANSGIFSAAVLTQILLAPSPVGSPSPPDTPGRSPPTPPATPSAPPCCTVRRRPSGPGP